MPPVKKSKKQFNEDREKRVDKMVTVGGKEILWSKHWDDPEEYAIDTEKEHLGGFYVGDRVVAPREVMDRDGYCVAEEGAEGMVMGITRPFEGGGVFDTPSHGPQLCVGWDDTDPTSIEPSRLDAV